MKLFSADGRLTGGQKSSVDERHRELIRITESRIMLQSSILESLKATDEEKARKSFTKSVEASLDPLHSNRNISIRGNSYG